MIKRIIFTLGICFLFIYNFNCSQSGTEPKENIILPESNLNFNDHIYPLFSAKCSSRSGCHTFNNPAANLALTDYIQVVNNHFMNNAPSEPLVRINDGENSPLYIVLFQEGYLGVPRMPFNGPYLNSNQYEGVKVWINEGAIPAANK
jgi:hypothetical protein